MNNLCQWESDFRRTEYENVTVIRLTSLSDVDSECESDVCLCKCVCPSNFETCSKHSRTVLTLVWLNVK